MGASPNLYASLVVAEDFFDDGDRRSCHREVQCVASFVRHEMQPSKHLALDELVWENLVPWHLQLAVPAVLVPVFLYLVNSFIKCTDKDTIIIIIRA